ncbi:hypothetical protein AC249_AIPGENE21967 [Exaiptasia diaphana]|nr:hypothetical protein AC249_AIPGENE21967 [Exaiptasia diaphana]
MSAVYKPKQAHCCVDGCNNDDRYPEKYVIRSHVKKVYTGKALPNNSINDDNNDDNNNDDCNDDYDNNDNKDDHDNMDVDCNTEPDTSQSDGSDWEQVTRPDLVFEEVSREGMVKEFLMTLTKLRLGLLEDNLAFRFKVNQSLVSEAVSTWLRFLAKELDWLIMWPSKGQVMLELPDYFRRLYPKVCCVIDCSESFTETPSALDIQAALWSEYKNHCTIKFLVSITPNGAPSYVSPCHGGRATDKCIVRDCTLPLSCCCVAHELT